MKKQKSADPKAPEKGQKAPTSKEKGAFGAALDEAARLLRSPTESPPDPDGGDSVKDSHVLRDPYMEEFQRGMELGEEEDQGNNELSGGNSQEANVRTEERSDSGEVFVQKAQEVFLEKTQARVEDARKRAQAIAEAFDATTRKPSFDERTKEMKQKLRNPDSVGEPMKTGEKPLDREQFEHDKSVKMVDVVADRQTLRRELATAKGKLTKAVIRQKQAIRYKNSTTMELNNRAIIVIIEEIEKASAELIRLTEKQETRSTLLRERLEYTVNAVNILRRADDFLVKEVLHVLKDDEYQSILNEETRVEMAGKSESELGQQLALLFGTDQFEGVFFYTGSDPVGEFYEKHFEDILEEYREKMRNILLREQEKALEAEILKGGRRKRSESPIRELNKDPITTSSKTKEHKMKVKSLPDRPAKALNRRSGGDLPEYTGVRWGTSTPMVPRQRQETEKEPHPSYFAMDDIKGNRTRQGGDPPDSSPHDSDESLRDNFQDHRPTRRRRRRSSSRSSAGSDPDPPSSGGSSSSDYSRDSRHRRPRGIKASRKLPNLELPKFDGEGALKFLTFFTTFKELIDENRNLTTMDKFAYLKNCLTGKASALVNQYPTIAQFYPTAMKTLEEFYGRTTKIIQEIIRDLNRSRSSNFKEWFMNAYATLMMLKCLNRNINKYGDILIPTFKERIPGKMEEDWSRIALRRERRGETVTLTQFLSFIQDELLLQSDRKDQNNSGKKKSDGSSKRDRKKGARKSQRYNAALYSNSNFKRNGNNPRSGSSSGSFPSKASQGAIPKRRPSPNYCFCCGAAPKHRIDDCKIAKGMNRKQILLLAKSHNICFRCLESTHSNKGCTAKPCSKCKGNHHDLLHFSDLNKIKGLTTLLGKRDIDALLAENGEIDGKDTGSSSSSEPSEGTSVSSTSTEATSSDSASSGNSGKSNTGSSENSEPEDSREPVLLAPNLRGGQKSVGQVSFLQVVRIPLFTKTGKIEVNAVLDTGAQRTFIARKVSRKLGLDGPKMRIHLNTINNEKTSQSAREVSVKIGTANNHIDAQCVEIDKICQPVGTAPFPKEAKYLEGLRVNNAYQHSNEEIGLLIGLDNYDQIVLPERIKGKPGEPLAINTIFGWVLYGKSFKPSKDKKGNTTVMMVNELETRIEDEVDRRVDDLEKL